MHSDCLFCKIARGELGTDLILETENLVAFRDINPQAPTHILIIPRQHIASLNELEPTHGEIMGEAMLAVQALAKQEDLHQGYRVVVNTGTHGGQSVAHLHFHLLGGRSLQWPPG